MPRRVGKLRIDSFRSWVAGTIRLVGSEDGMLDLLLIHPETERDTADDALAAAADPTDLRPVDQLLGGRSTE